MSNSGGGGLAGQHHAVVTTADPRKSGNAATAAAVQAAAAAAANRSAAVAAAVQAAAAAPEQQQPQDFDSWRHQQHQAAPPGYNLASDFYGLYQQNPFHHYTGFGVGGEGTWSNGDHMTFLSGYGTQLPGQETAQFGIDTAMFGAGAGGFGAFTQAPGYGFDFTGSAAGYSQWGAAANRAAAQQQGHAVGAAAQQQGHAAGPTAAAAQQGHGAATTVAGAVEHTQHHQWGQPQRQQVATTEQQQQYYRQEHYTQESRGRVAAAEQAMQGLHLATNNHTQDNKFQESKSEGAENSTKSHHNDTSSSNQASSGAKLTQSGSASSSGSQGGGSGQPKKMSWASVASQPAKPPTTTKPKKPGVLSPPQLPATNKPPSSMPPTNVEIGTWDHTATSGHQQNGGGIPTPATPLMGMPPPLPGSLPASTMHGHMPPATRGMMSGVGGVPMGGGGAAGGAWMGGAPGGRPVPLGHNSVMNGVIPHHQPPIQTSHPPPSSVAATSTPAAPCLVLDELKSTNNYNPREFDLNPAAARFFVVKSYSEDDIHRSIKYEIWCSTEHGNKRLDSAFREREGKGPVYLFYSVNGSGHFCGMAQMLSGVDYSTTAKVWAQDKWKGKFQVRWIYVKDVPNQQLRHIKLENNENKPVTNSRDTQEVPHEKGKAVLKILVSYKHNTSIFDDFSHYEKRQEEEEGRKPHQNGRSDRHDSHPHHGGHGGPPSHRRGGGGGDHYYNNNHHRDDTDGYRRGGGGEHRGEHRDDRRRGGDRDGDDNRGHGGGRGGRGGYYDRGGRGGKYQGGGGRRVSPVQKDGATSNGNQ